MQAAGPQHHRHVRPGVARLVVTDQVIKELQSWLDDAAVQSLSSPQPLSWAHRLLCAETLAL